MNTVVTSKEDILKSSCDIIIEKGFSALSIRAVASKAQISVGSVYNYFSSKSELICATVENIWRDIFHHSLSKEPCGHIGEYIIRMFECLEYGSRSYPGFLDGHALIFPEDVKADGAEVMKKTRNHILLQICRILQTDPQIRSDAFNGRYNREQCAKMLFSMILSSALHGEYDPYMVVETVQRALY